MFDTFDIVSFQFFLFQQCQQAGECLVITTAAGPRLDARAFFFQEVDLTQKLGDRRNIAFCAAEIIGIPLASFDYVGVRGKAFGGQLGCDNAIACDLPGMKGLGHGAEVAAQTSGFRTSDTQCHAGALHIELQQFAGGSGSTHRAVNGGGVPVAIGMYISAQTCADLVTDHPCRDYIAPRKM